MYWDALKLTAVLRGDKSRPNVFDRCTVSLRSFWLKDLFESLPEGWLIAPNWVINYRRLLFPKTHSSHHGNFPTKDFTLRSFKSCIGRAFLHSWIVEGLLMYQIERNPFVNAHSFGYNMGGALPVQGGVRKSPIHGNNLAKWTHLQIPSRRRHYADYNGLNRRRTHCPH